MASERKTIVPFDPKVNTKRGQAIMEQMRNDFAAFYDISRQSSTPIDLAALLAQALDSRGITLPMDLVSLLLTIIQVSYAQGYLDKSAEITVPTPPQP